MKRVVVCVSHVLWCACAHTPVRPAAWNLEDEVLARAVSYATRVPTAAREYRVAIPSRLMAERILDAAAEYAGLTVERPGVLRRERVAGLVPVVHLAIQRVEWPSEKEARVAFTYAIDAADAVPCSMRIGVGGADSRAWAYRSEGEEHCWPRPSKR